VYNTGETCGDGGGVRDSANEFTGFGDAVINPGAAAGLIACPSCDLLTEVARLAPGERARCSRCGHFLTRCDPRALERTAAFALTALVFLLIACSFPFLYFQAGSIQSVMTLPETALQLYREGMTELALLVAGFIILVPAAVLVLLLALAAGLAGNRPWPWLGGVARLVFHLQNWSMAEVFFIGVLVSLVKLSEMAEIVIGASFWAYAAFGLFFLLALSNLDRYQSWCRIERLGRG
jgi:paraquat-inducible protein A